jgi:Mg2+-importing ATPase
VDAELLGTPRRWDFRSLIVSMVGFGLVSSLFDALTFIVLIQVFHATPAMFQTAWFTESLLTELAVVAVMRTNKPFFRSPPSRLLLATSVAVALTALAIAFLPYAALLDFVALSPMLLGAIVLIVGSYVGVSELLKRRLAIMLPARGSSAAG